MKRRAYVSSDDKSKFSRGEFVAHDGEGLEAGLVDKWTQRDRYVLLAHSGGNFVWNDAGLSTVECFDFLLDAGRQFPKAIHVLFGASYDFNHWLHDLPKTTLKTLYTLGSRQLVDYDDFCMMLIPKKRFVLQHYRNPIEKWVHDEKGKLIRNIDASITLWDIQGFFQSSFVAAVESWLPHEADALKLIRRGKQRRGAFTLADRDFLIEYNATECRLLVALMERLRGQLDAAGLRLSTWYGAGSIAAATFKRYKVKEQIQPLPAPVEEAARSAFFGGRIELVKYGTHEGPIYHYDITSAYPHAMLSLPPLALGRWEHTTNNAIPREPFSVAKVQWNLAETPIIGPFPFRTHTGRVIFPQHGTRWIWFPELLAAYESGYQFDVLETWAFHYDSNELSPFRYIQAMFELRSEALARRDPIEKIWKLGYNSGYGKLAQLAGWNPKTGKIPPYHQEAYAGYITSHCRAAVLRAAIKAGSSLVSINTDGVFSTSPIDLDVSEVKRLGSWEAKKHDAIVAVQSGVYWYSDNGKWSEFSRGFGRPVGKGETKEEIFFSMQQQTKERIDSIQSGWKRRELEVYLESRRFITLGTALHSGGEWWQRWCNWYSEHSENGILGRSLRLYPDSINGKRASVGTQARPNGAHKRLLTTVPASNFYPVECEGESRSLPWIDNPATDGVDPDDERELEC